MAGPEAFTSILRTLPAELPPALYRLCTSTLTSCSANLSIQTDRYLRVRETLAIGALDDAHAEQLHADERVLYESLLTLTHQRDTLLPLADALFRFEETESDLPSLRAQLRAIRTHADLLAYQQRLSTQSCDTQRSMAIQAMRYADELLLDVLSIQEQCMAHATTLLNPTLDPLERDGRMTLLADLQSHKTWLYEMCQTLEHQCT